jgi:hypothetical protein
MSGHKSTGLPVLTHVNGREGGREGGTCKKNSSVTRIAHFFAIGKGLSTLEVSAHFIKISISNCLSMPAR